ncbi:AlpA family phage regulatory protein [Catenovulum sp. 2E275]|uniref:helix-turn-helix transcriptional regulator n=1 Tax=Catenovulum sp. 2E275 TaxID=2980497 RepID=UPI0021CE750F|nr:AlpA family phage regulatory protein [Catenovulum sp. 2E275]MCU4674290.1 AlpA family phage regulatory protein [Catenovulum sp. 2E275]
MTKPDTIQFIRKNEVLARFGYTNSTLYDRIKNKLMPCSINLGGNAVGWLKHEVDSVAAAIVEGKSNDEIKIIVSELEADRKNASKWLERNPAETKQAA